MRVHEIATEVGTDWHEVVDDLGITSGNHMTTVEDGKAEAYIAAKTEDKRATASGERTVRFWTPRGGLRILRADGDHIVFDDPKRGLMHAYECADGSDHARVLREKRDVERVYEVVPEPEKDDKRRYQFRSYLEQYINTGHDRTDGANTTRVKAIQRILPDDVLATIPVSTKMVASRILDELVARVSFKVEDYPIELGG